MSDAESLVLRSDGLGIDTNQLCEATVYLSRQRYGNLDPNYGEGGTISAEHHNRGTFFVDPKP